MAYVTADQIRAEEPEVFKNTATYTDVRLLLWNSAHAEPEINGIIGNAGYTVPFVDGVVPEIIQSIAARLATAHGLPGAISR